MSLGAVYDLLNQKFVTSPEEPLRQQLHATAVADWFKSGHPGWSIDEELASTIFPSKVWSQKGDPVLKAASSRAAMANSQKQECSNVQALSHHAERFDGVKASTAFGAGLRAESRAEGVQHSTVTPSLMTSIGASSGMPRKYET